MVLQNVHFSELAESFQYLITIIHYKCFYNNTFEEY